VIARPETRAASAPTREETTERQTLRERMAVVVYSSMERVAMTWPRRPARALFEVLAAAAYRLAPGTRATVAVNLARILGRPPRSPLVQDATREAFSLYARYWYDTFAIRNAGRKEMNERFRMDGLDLLDGDLEAGRGAIVALPHTGNWDAAGHFMALNGYRLAAVAEELRPRRMFELFLRHRQELGMRVVPLTKGRSVGLHLAQLLSENWLVALVADRDLSGRGVDVEMFGATRKLPAGPALLALSTGSPLHVCPLYTTDDGWRCRINPAIEIERTGKRRADVMAVTRVMAAQFERAIAANPVDWHMFQPAWPP
jgi:phosphatidylinositol dimannoside acyltransferase